MSNPELPLLKNTTNPAVPAISSPNQAKYIIAAATLSGLIFIIYYHSR